MSLTRTQIETILLKRCGAKMAAAGMDSSTVTGNADLSDPISATLFDLGITPADITNPSDDDLALVADADTQRFLSYCELRLLENIAGNLDAVDVTVGPRREALNQLHDQVVKSIERLADRLGKLYGLGMGSLDAGSISLDFQENNDDLVDG